jgi:hypothetical protein
MFYFFSVADPDPGSGAFLTPGSRVSDSLKIDLNFFLQQFKHKIIFSFVTFVATKKGMTTKFFTPPLLLLLLDPGSVIRDGKKSGSWIRDKHPRSATLHFGLPYHILSTT